MSKLVRDVYLCGGITGMGYDEATDWRRIVTEDLKDVGIETIDPMRGKEELDYVQNFSGNGFSQAMHPIATAKAIVGRDYFDVERCDIVLANLLGYTQTTSSAAEFVISQLDPLIRQGRGSVAKENLGEAMRVIVEYIQGISKASIGSVAEIAWAHHFHKPVVLVMEAKGNVHDHAFINEMITHRAYDLGNGVEMVKQILL